MQVVLKMQSAVQETILKRTSRKLKVEIEARNLDDVRKILEIGGIDRIMLDNFSVIETREAVQDYRQAAMKQNHRAELHLIQ